MLFAGTIVGGGLQGAGNGVLGGFQDIRSCLAVLLTLDVIHVDPCVWADAAPLLAAVGGDLKNDDLRTIFQEAHRAVACARTGADIHPVCSDGAGEESVGFGAFHHGNPAPGHAVIAFHIGPDLIANGFPFQNGIVLLGRKLAQNMGILTGAAVYLDFRERGLLFRFLQENPAKGLSILTFHIAPDAITDGFPTNEGIGLANLSLGQLSGLEAGGAVDFGLLGEDAQLTGAI